MKQAHFFSRVSELPEKQFVIREIGGRSVGGVRLNSGFVFILNQCPHAGAPICQGKIKGSLSQEVGAPMRYDQDRMVLCCPWHNWEYSLDDGRLPFPSRYRLARLDFEIVGEDIFIKL